jgi:hypothetical protein
VPLSLQQSPSPPAPPPVYPEPKAAPPADPGKVAAHEPPPAAEAKPAEELAAVATPGKKGFQDDMADLEELALQPIGNSEKQRKIMSEISITGNGREYTVSLLIERA